MITNRLAEAEPLYRRALAIDEKALGPTIPTFRDSQPPGRAAAFHRPHTEAEPLFRRALAIIEKNFGPDHPDVASNLNNLAKLC